MEPVWSIRDRNWAAWGPKTLHWLQCQLYLGIYGQLFLPRLPRAQSSSDSTAMIIPSSSTGISSRCPLISGWRRPL